MTQLTFTSNGIFGGFASWKHVEGATTYFIRWNTGGYWVFVNWPYDGEPRSYTSPIVFPTTGWQIYNTTNPMTFNVTLGTC